MLRMLRFAGLDAMGRGCYCLRLLFILLTIQPMKCLWIGWR